MGAVSTTTHTEHDDGSQTHFWVSLKGNVHKVLTRTKINLHKVFCVVDFSAGSAKYHDETKEKGCCSAFWGFESVFTARGTSFHHTSAPLVPAAVPVSLPSGRVWSILPLVRLHVQVVENVLGELHRLFPRHLGRFISLRVHGVQRQQLLGQQLLQHHVALVGPLAVEAQHLRLEVRQAPQDQPHGSVRRVLIGARLAAGQGLAKIQEGDDGLDLHHGAPAGLSDARVLGRVHLVQVGEEALQFGFGPEAQVPHHAVPQDALSQVGHVGSHRLDLTDGVVLRQVVPAETNTVSLLQSKLPKISHRTKPAANF